MEPGATLVGGLWNSFSLLGQIAFRWVPGVFLTMIGDGTPPPPGPPAPHLQLIQSPISVPQLVDFLQISSAPDVYQGLFHNWSVFVAWSLFFSLLLAALIVYCVIRIQQIRYVERQRFAAMQHTVAAHDVPKTQLRWQRIKEETSSDSEQAWRLAILEADIMLNELLDVLGLKGETMGDKMKRADPGTFRTIDLAWEAHAVRNEIAHEGFTRALSARETQRVIGLYERVFKEFKFVE